MKIGGAVREERGNSLVWNLLQTFFFFAGFFVVIVGVYRVIVIVFLLPG